MRLAGDGADAVRRGVDLARRLIVENGVTYNVYADSQGRDRPWVLDPLPILLPRQNGARSKQASRSVRGCSTRCSADMYGPQRLLADGSGAAAAAVRSSEFSLALPWH